MALSLHILMQKPYESHTAARVHTHLDEGAVSSRGSCGDSGRAGTRFGEAPQHTGDVVGEVVRHHARRYQDALPLKVLFPQLLTDNQMHSPPYSSSSLSFLIFFIAILSFILVPALY